jgi:hypothetical protein
MAMNELEQIQAEGPAQKTQGGYNAWYTKILQIANRQLVRANSGFPIHGSLEDGELASKEEQPLNYNPHTRRWEHAGYPEEE